MLTAGPHIELLERLLPIRISKLGGAFIKGYRRMTAPFRVLPDFMIIGARRSGTTSLYQYLIQHPAVLPALRKEIFFFDNYYSRGTPWYRLYFPTVMEKKFREVLAREAVLTGEATPSLLANPSVPARVFQTNPRVKLIAMLRNPVDAVYSSYQFGLARGVYTHESNPFAQLVDRELSEWHHLRGHEPVGQSEEELHRRKVDLIPRHIYCDQLRSWLARFPREQLHVVIAEEFFDRTSDCFNNVLAYLHLSPIELASYPRHNASKYAPIDPRLRQRLVDFFAPHNRRLSELLNLKIHWDR